MCLFCCCCSAILRHSHSQERQWGNFKQPIHYHFQEKLFPISQPSPGGNSRELMNIEACWWNTQMLRMVSEHQGGGRGWEGKKVLLLGIKEKRELLWRKQSKFDCIFLIQWNFISFPYEKKEQNLILEMIHSALKRISDYASPRQWAAVLLELLKKLKGISKWSSVGE